MEAKEMLSKFDLLVTSLRSDKQLHLRVKIYEGDNQITIETGRDCPERIINRIFNQCDKCHIKFDDICICASTGTNARLIKSSIIGIPKSNWK